MVLVKRSYLKNGVEVALKTPKIRVGNNLGEGETVTVLFKKGCWENEFKITKQIKTPTGIETKKLMEKTYTFLGEFNGEDVYVGISRVVFGKICTLIGATNKEECMRLENQKISFTRNDSEGKTIIDVSFFQPKEI